MGALGRFMRSLKPGDDHQLAAEQYAGRESASDRAKRVEAERAEAASAKRRAQHRARVFRNGDAASKDMPRRYRVHNG